MKYNGLLTSSVDVSLGGKNVGYYISKGYNIQQKKTQDHGMVYDYSKTLHVNIDNLYEGSAIIVDYMCSICKENKQSTFKSFVKRYNGANMSICPECSNVYHNSGERSHKWNRSISKEDRAYKRNGYYYINTIKNALKRDNYTCVCCGNVGGKLEGHHLDGYHLDIEGRSELSNIVTLCKSCHNLFHSVFGRKNNTKEQFEEFINKYFNKTYTQIEFNEMVCSKLIHCYEDNVDMTISGYLNREHNIDRNTFRIGIYTAIRRKRGYYKKHYIYTDDYIKENPDYKINYIKDEDIFII